MTPLLAALVLPFFCALLCLVAARRRPGLVRGIAVFGSAALLSVGILLLQEVLRDGHVVLRVGNWPAPFGIVLVADLLAALMVLITGVVALSVAIYALRDIDTELTRANFYAFMFFLLMGVNGAFIAGDLFNLYVWFEVMLLTSFVLITFEGRPDQLEGGVKYMVLNLLASFLFLSGVGLLYGKLGTLNMADIARALQTRPDAFLVNSSGMLLLGAFGIKAGLFPFFFWLPASYHTPRVVISALLAGLLTKVGVYACIRSYTLVFSTQFGVVQGTLLFLAGATMVTGVLGAAAHYHVRKILSFHIISQIGYMIMGLAIGSVLAVAGAIFYTLHHIVVKTNLFLIGGLIQRRCGSEDLKSIGGLYRTHPGLALLFLIPALSLAGIPPLSGFWAKFSVLKAGVEGQHYVLVTVALLVGVLTLFSMTKIWAEAFWKDAPPNARPPERLGFRLLAPCVAMAALTVYLGLWSGPLFRTAQRAAEQLLNPAAYIEAVLTTSHHEPPTPSHP